MKSLMGASALKNAQYIIYSPTVGMFCQLIKYNMGDSRLSKLFLEKKNLVTWFQIKGKNTK